MTFNEIATILISFGAVGISLYSLYQAKQYRKEDSMRYLKQQKYDTIKECDSFIRDIQLNLVRLERINISKAPERAIELFTDVMNSGKNTLESVENVRNKVSKLDYRMFDVIDEHRHNLNKTIQGFEVSKTYTDEIIQIFKDMEE